MATKAELETLVREYREENSALRTKLEARKENDNICDTVFDFFADCAEYLSTQCSALRTKVPF